MAQHFVNHAIVSLVVIICIQLNGCRPAEPIGPEAEFVSFYQKHQPALYAKHANLEFVAVYTANDIPRTEVISGWISENQRLLTEFHAPKIDVNVTAIDPAVISEALGQSPKYLYGTNPDYSFALNQTAPSKTQPTPQSWRLLNIEPKRFSSGPKLLVHAAIGDPYQGFWFSDIGRDPDLRVLKVSERDWLGKPSLMLDLEIAGSAAPMTCRYYFDRDDGRCLGCEGFNSTGGIQSSYQLVYRMPSSEENSCSLSRVDHWFPNTAGELVLGRRLHVVKSQPLLRENTNECYLSAFGFPELNIDNANSSLFPGVAWTAVFFAGGAILGLFILPRIIRRFVPNRQ
jgi:hypothetical protein